MSKLVDKERLAKLAKALDDRAKAAVATEKERAMAAEQAVDAKANANAADIAAIKNENTGLLKQAKDYADGVGNTEKERAEGAEGALSDRIDAIDAKLKGAVDNFFDGAEQGTKVAEMVANINANKAKLADIEAGKTVKAAIDAAVAVEKGRAEGIENGLAGRIAANEAFIAKQPGIDKEQDRRLGVLEGLISGGEGDGNALTQLQNSINAAQAAADKAQGEVDAVEQRLDVEGGLVSRIAANEANIARLDGAVNVEGSVKKQIKDAIDAVNGAADALEDRVEAVENFKNVTYPAAEQKVREDFAAADAQVLADAKKYADEEITKLVDSAPDAMNTLNELAEAIDANKGVYDAYIEQHATAMANMKKDLQAEIDADVKVVADALADEKDAKKSGSLAEGLTQAFQGIQEQSNRISGLNATQENHASRIGIIEGEGAGSIKAAVKAEKERAEGVEAGFETRIAANEAKVAAQPAIDAEQDRRIKALEDANKDGGAMKKAIDAAQKAADDAQDAAEAAQGAADKAQGEVDALEKRLDDPNGLVNRLEAVESFKQGHSHEGLQGEIDAVEGRVDALETFKNAHDHSVMEKGIADNKAAIEKEVKDRNDAIAKALEVYSTTEEMKGIIGNVVNSLALTMENDKVVLKLGGVDGIELASVSLDLATDADINAIVAGLGA